MALTEIEALALIEERFGNHPGRYKLRAYLKLTELNPIEFEAQTEATDLRTLWISFRSSVEGRYTLAIEVYVNGSDEGKIVLIETDTLDIAFGSRRPADSAESSAHQEKHTKPYELRFDKRDGYLFAHVKSDTVDAQMVKQYTSEIAGKCNMLGAQRVMVLREIPAMMTDEQIEGLVDTVLEVFRGVSVAYVNPHQSNSPGLRLGALTANRRGGDLQIFDSPDEAEAWIMGK